jgi:hypothetical protein
MDIYQQLRHRLKEAAEKNNADGILLSGGLDTSILAFIARPRIAFTVALKDSHAPDLSYTERISNLLSIKLKTREFTVGEAITALPEVIRILKTFDLALPNDLSIYFALKRCILRKSFEGLIPPDVVWREKEPIEYGSGSTRLHKVISDMVSDEQFQLEKKKTGTKFISKEHCFYYHIYEEVVGQVPEAKSNEKGCPCCGASMCKWHCRVCGFSPPLEANLTMSS